MPRLGILLGTGLVSSTVYPYSIVVGGQEVAPSSAVLQSITFQDNGDDEPGRATFRLWDATNALALLEQSVVIVNEYSSTQQVWLGFLQRRIYDPSGLGRYIDLECVSVSSLLDEILVVREPRPVESDQSRALYLWGKYARWPLSGDVQFVTQTNASLAADDLVDLTLRQALARTMGLAGSTVRMAIDALGRLHWFAGTETNDAPYDINVAMTPGAGNIAPDNLAVERDATIKNRAYLRGATADGSGWYQDDASVGAYGPRETFIDAPSADTAAKAEAIARLYFGRMAQPRTRGTFSTEEPYNGWRAGQNVTITDPANDLSAAAFRLSRVTTTFTKGTGTKRYVVEFGASKASASDDPYSADATQGVPDPPTVLSDVISAGGSTIGNGAVTVTDANGDERVILGALGGGDYGLKVVSSDGSTVIIDGTSNMFKIVASGTLTRNQGANSSGSSQVSITGTSLPSTTSPAFVAFVTEGSSPAVYNNRDGDRFLKLAIGFVAQTSGGSPIQRMEYILWQANAFSGIDGSNNPAINLGMDNADGTSKDAFMRYHILKEAAV